MKKMFVLIFLIILFGTISVYADNEIYETKTICLDEIDVLPQTRTSSVVSLFDFGNTLKDRVLEAWNSRNNVINVKGLGYTIDDFEALIDDYRSILYEDYPIYTSIVYTSGTYKCSCDNGEGLISELIVPGYDESVSYEEFDAICKAVSDETQKILLHIRKGMNDFEKVITVHDYMVLNYQYDTSGQNNDITIMTKKKGMCMSYAFAFNHIMNELGIESSFVSSKAMNHAWNLVMVDGYWYHIDLTWDDPIFDHYSHVHHKYALESTAAISYHPDPGHIHSAGGSDASEDCDCHYGFDIDGSLAYSTLYDDASWRNGSSAIVFAGGKEYWVSGNDLVCSDGKTVYSGLRSGENWPIDSKYGFEGAVYAGLAVYDDVLYFNSDKFIMSYDISGENFKIIKRETGIQGLYIDNGILKYSRFNLNNGHFEYAGEIKLGEFDVRIVTDAGGKVTVDFYKENDAKVMIFAYGKGNISITDINKSGYVSASFESSGDELTLFFWGENLRPLKPKQVVK